MVGMKEAEGPKENNDKTKKRERLPLTTSSAKFETPEPLGD